MVSALGYGEAGNGGETFRLNDGSGGNSILAGQAVALVFAVGTAPNTGGKHPLVSRSGLDDQKTIGVAVEGMTKGPAAATGEGEFGRVITSGFCLVRMDAAAAVGLKIGPDANGDWSAVAGATGEFGVLLEASAAAGDLVAAYMFDRTSAGFGGA